ncbi:protein of unknown function [Thermanaeromonas toyohensis ToBE]|uniref:DUF370 domain-containing protein n=1 Tax=Thermanaeromonas toyohensis ToBE TaxID=698762 RepID=A0A1W1V517_9FIRM|nr:extracellular matrix/biofilm biosynthesis regulator RemA family protein [Thermanaeromonas toyohensis]SMB88428.1 protein of unknown function [Thermanaeromonas toyohensis ToBE]
MYLHIGGEIVIPLREIVAILDYEKALRSPANKEFLSSKAKAPQGVKSCIVTKDNKVFYSPISSLTLARRAESFTHRYIAAENYL